MKSILERYRNLDRINKSGLFLSLFGVGGWTLAIIVVYLLGVIFKQPPDIKLTHFVVVPLLFVMLSMISNFFEWNKRWHIRPGRITAFLTNLHGIWGLYVTLQMSPDYNGYLCLFLFSFGLLFVKISFGFWPTMIFSLAHLVLASTLFMLLKIEVGPDDCIFFLFAAFYGISSAFVNELNRHRSLHLKSAIAERKHGYEQLEKILFPHQIQQIVAGAFIESTLPIKQGYGCCLIFEVMDSEKIKHELAQEYIREVFRLFSLLLRDRYDPKAQTSKGFRIAEMNSKFVCSVGFPFQCPGNERPSRVSLKIARDFIGIFQENILKLEYHRPIHCSVSIAAGEMEGFFTRGFPIEYQLHGDPLIKAEQINEMSKQAQKRSGRDGSIIVIQDRVFNSLSSMERRDFQLVEVGQGRGELLSIQRIHVQHLIGSAESRRDEASLASA